MIHRLINVFIAACVIVLPCTAVAAKPVASLGCYRAEDPVKCFIGAAKTKLAQVAGGDERADAIGEMLYTLAATHSRDDALLKEATELSSSGSVRPVKQMDMLYAIDLYASVTETPATQTFMTALRRFASLEHELKGSALIELYVNACSIIAWDDSFRERWYGFAQSVCTPVKLQAIKPQGVAYQALVLTMIPVAMTLSDDRNGFAESTDIALSWLRAAEKSAAKSKKSADKDFVSFIGVLMHTMNSLCLDAFDEPEAADDAIDISLKVLRRMEMRVGISGRSANLRRQVVESLFEAGREAEAKKMLRQMLSRVDADPNGRNIPFAEQIAILLQAAKLEHIERLDNEQTCIPEGSVEI